MSLFEEYLTLGPWMTEEQRLAIYKFLLISKRDKFHEDAIKLIGQLSLETSIANGVILYTLNGRNLGYQARKIGELNWTTTVRTIRLLPFKRFSEKKISHFFAQAELDVLRNYPNKGVNEFEERSYTFNTHPFYVLDYYGKGKLQGFINKVRTKDDPLLDRLLAS